MARDLPTFRPRTMQLSVAAGPPRRERPGVQVAGTFKAECSFQNEMSSGATSSLNELRLSNLYITRRWSIRCSICVGGT